MTRMPKLIIALAFLALSQACFADDLHVPAEYPTIQAAIDAAYDGDTVIVADGTYTGDGNRDIDFLGKAITVCSESGPENCIIDCNANYEDQHYAFDIHSTGGAKPVLDGFTITNGFQRDDGIILCRESDPIVTNCVITANVVTKYGGAISCYASSPVITKCIISQNEGIAVYCWGGSPVITNCTISGNSDERVGGGVYFSTDQPDKTLTVNNCLIAGNSGGAGIYCQGTMTLNNCLITNNSGGRNGGAVQLRHDGWWDGPPRASTINNCTITHNNADKGGGIYSYHSDPIITNSIFWENEAPNGPQIYMDGYHDKLSLSYTDLQGGPNDIYISDNRITIEWGPGNIDADPCFPLTADYHLMSDSPCIDAGDPNYFAEPNETDVEGNPRLTGAAVDMGAYEYNPDGPPVLVIYPPTFSYTQSSQQIVSKTLSIRNAGAARLKWEIIEDCQWVRISPRKGVSTGKIDRVNLRVNPAGLEVGYYECILQVSDPDAANSPQTVTIDLHVSGQTIYVPSQVPTIQDAIEHVLEGGAVIVADGTYTGEGNRDIDFLGKAITVKSESGPENCIIDCNGTEDDHHRGFYFHSGEDHNSILDGFTITNAYARSGAAVYCNEASPRVTNCIITDNSASSGGGGINGGSCKVEIINCTISHNSAEWGGGLSHCDGLIDNSIITYNSAADTGGGINCQYNSPRISNCTITNNSASGRGGGIVCWASSPTILNCTIAVNQSASHGGGIYCGYSSSPSISQCTISDNQTEKYGGGLFCSWASCPTIGSSIVYGNKAEEGNQLAVYGDCSLQVSYSNVQAGAGGVYLYGSARLSWPSSNIDAPPAFVDSENGDYRLSSSSPCIDAGAPYYYLIGPYLADINGDCRFAGNGVDMGSYEFGSSPDRDADLLSDTDEALYACDPNNPDTDVDGLADGVEMFRGTNPLVANGPEGISVPDRYECIQEGVFLAFPLETITVSPGTYSENVHLRGKNLILQSTDPLDNQIVDTTVIDANGFGSVIAFAGTEDSSCMIKGFTVTNGGFSGINGNGCKALIENNTITSNFMPMQPANSGGGGILNCDGVIQNNIISNNRAEESGGGIARCDGVIQNNLIIGNYAGYMGGGISCIREGTPLIRNCTIADNFAIYPGGAVAARYDSNPEISSCILWGNSSPEVHAYSSSISVTFSCVKGGSVGEGNVLLPPLFADAENGDYHLLAESPCIDAGDPNYVPQPEETDIDGKPRVLDGNEDGMAVVDMGAYEFGSLPPIEARMKLMPQTLNCAARGKYIKAHITLPEEIFPEDIDVNTPAVADPPDIDSEYIKLLPDDTGPVRLEIAFDRRAFCAELTEPGQIEITVTGFLTTGQFFYATDTITIKKTEAKRKLINQAQPARPLRRHNKSLLKLERQEK